MAFIESGKSFDKEKHRAKMKKIAMNMDRAQYCLRIPTHIYHQFQKKLIEKRKKMAPVLLDMILKYIEN